MRILLAIILFASPIWPLGRNPLPGDPFIIVNKESNQLAFIDDGKVQHTFPVATGKTTTLTPEGLFNVTVKAKNPYYRKKNIPGGDPRNPLGSRWIGFDAKGTDGRIYGIHGTNQPSSIGKYISNGCIRMHNKHVEYLFDQVPVGTKVLVVKTNKSFHQLGKDHGAIK
ncbi:MULTISPECIES: L,D-transpeptidase [Rossellomorea]|jgi:lipoprotein-anchoring transpeptidase ErfK/SrfK|uniref:L,D-transpeptidase n=1 Tax=Rossellomorea TaxID=2837508 RepID=UPI0011E93774|nr:MULTISPECIES: L,D-transpeptidase [Rossellomorea]MDT9024784.1 L,D-transpeptidase [Rossellomorea sp. YC4-1]TYS87480.1 L,D-transpeptidase [Rossellomorea aquimaris]